MTVRKLGGATIEKVEEICGPGFKPGRMFPKFDQEAFDAQKGWMVPEHVQEGSDRLIGSVHTWIVKTPRHTILIDTCLGNHKQRHNPGWSGLNTPFLDRLKACGCPAESVDFVMCTHLHVDHVGWNTKLENGRWVPTFPNARYVFSSDEYKYWEGENAKEQVNPFADSVLPIVEAKRADLVKNDFALDDMVRLESTPGHTPDHVAVQIGKLGNPAAVVTGDLIHSPLQARFPEISMRADYDMKQSAVTRRKFLECYCDTATLMCMAHFPSPSVGKLTRWGDGFKLKAEAV